MLIISIKGHVVAHVQCLVVIYVQLLLMRSSSLIPVDNKLTTSIHTHGRTMLRAAMIPSVFSVSMWGLKWSPFCRLFRINDTK
jgi:hypothetical protein